MKTNKNKIEAKRLKEKCPVCKHNLYSIDDQTGVMVWCAQPIEVCASPNSPSGHGKTVKEAFRIVSKRKWS
jgi:hypothetical protein